MLQIIRHLTGIRVALGLGSPREEIEYWLLPATAALLGLGFFVSLPIVYKRRGPPTHSRLTGRLLRGTATWVADAEELVRHPSWRLLGSVGYLLFDVAVLWACLRAVGTPPPVFAIVTGYQIGYLANLIPIPGGIGVLEGGLLGALLVYGLPAAPTAAAVVLYHAISLWVPVIGGTIGFGRLRSTLTARAGKLEQLKPREHEHERERERELQTSRAGERVDEIAAYRKVRSQWVYAVGSHGSSSPRPISDARHLSGRPRR